MGLNRKVSALAQSGADVDALLADRTIPQDGLIWLNAIDLLQLPGDFTEQRVAAADWSITHTASGSVTRRVALPVSQLVRQTESKGLLVIDVVWSYRIETVNATSIDVTCHRTSYVHGNAPSVAAFGGTIVDASYDTSHDSAAERAATGQHTLVVTLPEPEFHTVDNAIVMAEFVAVLPNTCKLTIHGAGVHVAHDLV